MVGEMHVEYSFFLSLQEMESMQTKKAWFFRAVRVCMGKQ